MLTIILVVGYFLFCVGMAFFLDYRTKKRKLNETADLLRLYHRLGADLCIYPHISLHLL